MKNKQTVKLSFVDTHQHLASFFYNVLSDRFNIELSDDPEFVIFGDRNFGESNKSIPRGGKVTKIFYTGENERPENYDCDYAISFDHNDSQWHFRLPLFVVYMWALEKIHKIPYGYNTLMQNYRECIKSKEDFCTFVVGNDRGGHRNAFFDALNKIKKVNSPGKVRNNVDVKLEGEWAKIEYLSKHKFNIAFENSSHPGYVTEKILHAFYAGTVPIYWGSETVVQDFNPASFINVNDYASIDDVIADVLSLDNDDDRYNAMLNAPKFSRDHPPYYLNLENLTNWFEGVFTRTIEKRL